MSPKFTAFYVVNCSSCNAVSPANIVYVPFIFPDCSNVGFGDFRILCLFAAALAPFLNHIELVPRDG